MPAMRGVGVDSSLNLKERERGVLRKIWDRFTLTAAQYCAKYGHDVRHWRQTTGQGKFGDCERCGAEIEQEPYSS